MGGWTVLKAPRNANTRTTGSHAPTFFKPAAKQRGLNPYRSSTLRVGEGRRHGQFAILLSFLEGLPRPSRHQAGLNVDNSLVARPPNNHKRDDAFYIGLGALEPCAGAGLGISGFYRWRPTTGIAYLPLRDGQAVGRASPPVRAQAKGRRAATAGTGAILTRRGRAGGRFSTGGSAPACGLASASRMAREGHVDE